MRVLIKNGTVVNADGQAKQDLLIESGIVRQLGNNISPQLPYEEIDATGCYVFPGGVDVHTHFNIDVGIARSCDDFFTGTRAAACGGTTTIIDHTLAAWMSIRISILMSASRAVVMIFLPVPAQLRVAVQQPLLTIWDLAQSCVWRYNNHY